jgi:hypothetical protein
VGIFFAPPPPPVLVCTSEVHEVGIAGVTCVVTDLGGSRGRCG